MQWQLPMKRMLYALAPLSVAAIYFFGWRALAVLVVANASAFVTEWLFLRQYREPVSSAAFVTGTLLGLSLPPSLPLWMVAVGAAFGVAFGKMVFGGFGKNVFNPALVGRAFLYVCFPRFMTPSQWPQAFTGGAGGLAAWMPDAVTSATPLAAARTSDAAEWVHLAIGNVSGSLGETSAILIVIAGLYITWKKAANWRFIVSGLLATLVCQTLVWQVGFAKAANPLTGVFGGSYLFALFFFITEPVSGPKTNPARWMYGALFGILGVVIRTFSGWPAGNMFAVILCNTFAPTMDYVVNAIKTARKERAKAAAASAKGASA